MRKPIIVPKMAFPKKDPVNPCPCQDIEVRLEYQTCLLMWTVDLGVEVQEGDVICEGELEKKALEFKAPCSGILVEKCLEDDAEFSAGDILGYIEEK